MPISSSGRDMRIGDVSRAAGVNIETIRYYERTGVVPCPARSASGQRLYTQDDLRRLRFVRRARELGFGLGEIGHLLDLATGRPNSCEEAYQITVAQLAATRERIRDLKKMASVLESMASQCARGTVTACPIVDSLFDGPPAGTGSPA